MRSSTFTLTAFVALLASVAAAPVALPEEAVAVVASPSSSAGESIFEVAEQEESSPEETFNILDKRATQKCTKVSQCKNSVPSNAQRTCSSKKCSWSCKSGYTKSGSKCVKNAVKKVASTSSAVNLAATTYSGTGTWFTQNGNYGACGKINSDSTYLVALQTNMYANGSKCGKKVKITANGKTITAVVADECPTCGSSTNMDLSVGAFKGLASLDAGVVSMKWQFV
ncbi:hypothetical protein JCM8547_000850 [Rhodosporidiobolus lusitaniae]